MSLGEDPAVLTWRIALAPRPRPEPVGRHWWQQLVTDTFHAAKAAREALRESGQDAGGAVAGTAGSAAGYYQLSEAEFAQVHPPVTLQSVMVALSQGSLAPESMGAGW
jgi:hypothetical protein